ncbi:MAG TPA: SHOCT domain-containing protein [Acidimicrobiales bacterium]
MFGRKKRLERSLEESGGQTAWATVLEVKQWSSSGGANMAPGQSGSFTHHCKIRLRVEPEADPAFEATIHQEFRDARGETPPIEGWKVGVIYDPADHSKVIIDESKNQIRPGLTNVQADESQTRREKLVALASDPAALQQYIQESTAMATTQGHAAPVIDTADQLTKLADLLDRGVLTQAEFDAQKAKLLGGAE